LTNVDQEERQEEVGIMGYSDRAGGADAIEHADLR